MSNNSGLYRSQYDTVLGGVCGGIGKSLKIDPVLVRIIFVLLAVFGGSGVLLYIILWIAVPVNPDETIFNNEQNANNMENDHQKSSEGASGPLSEKAKKPGNDGNLIAGLILITLGAIFLLERWIRWLDFADLWPLLLVVGGIVLIRRSFLKP
jgi:phage shock protein PspC (stress-responsive transcriptional regulator)